MRRTWAAAALAAALLVAAAVPAGAGPTGARHDVGTVAGTGGPTQLRCGDVVSGAVTLTDDLECPGTGPADAQTFHVCDWDAPCPVVGLRLEAGAVLDLGGHTLIGPWGRFSIAIDLPDNGPVTIRNGTVARWSIGVASPDLSSGGEAVTVEDMTFRNDGTSVNVADARLTVRHTTFEGGAVGVLCFFGSTCSTTDSTVTGADWGSYCSDSDCDVRRSRFRDDSTAVFHDGSGRTTLTDSDVRDSRRGFAAHSTSGPHMIRRTFWAGNDTAIELVASGATVTGNVLHGNGVAVSTSDYLPWQPARDHRLTGNLVVGNRDGIVSTSSALTFRRNVVTDNTGWGVHAPDGIDGGGNVVVRNGRDR